MPGEWGGEEELRRGLLSGVRKLWELMDLFTLLIVVMASQVHIYSKLNKLYTISPVSSILTVCQ